MTSAYLRVPEAQAAWRRALTDELDPAPVTEGLVFVPAPVSDEWEPVASELGEAFDLTQRATAAGAPVVYILQAGDLLGQRGAGRAMLACGLLSGARTLAFETRKEGIPANVLAVEREFPARSVARWARRLLEGDGPSGELVRLGAGHVGKALP